MLGYESTGGRSLKRGLDYVPIGLFRTKDEASAACDRLRANMGQCYNARRKERGFEELSQLKAAYRLLAAWRDLGLPGKPAKCVPSCFRGGHQRPAGAAWWRQFALAKNASHHAPRASAGDRQKAGPKLPPLRAGTENELRELAERREFTVEALQLAESRGFLRFCNRWGHAAWCVGDQRQQLHEFQRVDGQKWPAYGRLLDPKAHCMGTSKP